jgi:hypothetical protein
LAIQVGKVVFYLHVVVAGDQRAFHEPGFVHGPLHKAQRV